MKNMKNHNPKEDTIQLLLTRRHPEYEKYAGKHVFIIEDKIIPFSTSKRMEKKLKELKKRYKKLPTIVFVPKKEVTYIL